MPVSDDRADFKKTWRQNFDPDQDHRDQHDHDGHNRVHRDAELAMIGVIPNRMHMRYLGDG
ncbi:MAG: hypothetical protein WCF30_05760 [Terracidiphilus sp.]